MNKQTLIMTKKRTKTRQRKQITQRKHLMDQSNSYREVVSTLDF